MSTFDEIYNKIYSTLASEKKSLVFGISAHQKSHLLAASTGKWLYVVANEERAADVTKELKAYGKKVIYLPPQGDILLGKNVAALLPGRVTALGEVATNKVDIVVATAEALFGYTLPPKILKEYTICLKKGQEIEVQDLVAALIASGYRRVAAMPTKGEFCARGDVVQVQPVNSEKVYKIEFLYDEIETIKPQTADISTKADGVKSLTLYPVGEMCLPKEDIYKLFDKIEKMRSSQNRAAALRTDDIVSDIRIRAEGNPFGFGLSWLMPFVKDEMVSVFDYFQGFSLAIDEPKQVFDAMSAFLSKFYNRVNTLSVDGEVIAAHKGAVLSEREMTMAFSKMPSLGMSAFVEKISEQKGSTTIASVSLPTYLKNSNMFISYVAESLNAGINVSIYAQDEDRKLMIMHLLGENASKVNFIKGTLPHGFSCASVAEIIIGTDDIISSTVVNHPGRMNIVPPKVGDYVVHDDFGIGRCLGLVHMKTYAGEQDYILLQYADSNKIYLPVSQMGLLSVYNGSDKEPKLSNPNKDEFVKAKAKAKKSIRKLAFDLVDLYAKRERSQGFKYQKGGELEQAFSKGFPYEETAGQRAAIADVFSDMEKGKVMDRLICGDVGFGKTEVALRAAFKTVLAGKQVAILAPTTILAEQHFQTASARLAQFGIKCACLTRFCTPAESAEILKGVKNGSISVVVGTHRLLSKDVEFFDIGLLVLDEEQRFGVEHKDKIKSLRTNINVLSMSATPIPRTLHMSLSGIRDISVIDTPPLGRKPVKTIVQEYSPDLLKSAIESELARGGQVFVLYNNVERLSGFASEIKEMFPDATVAIGHGRMASAELEDNVHKFFTKQAEILVCTTIIENGIDVPDANTLFVVNADKLGLSQMYQLKGRVGRSSRIATAYFTYPQGLALAADAEKRLNALMDNTDLGSGYRLAMMDLEIRGAGNILGAEQHGHIEKVGYDVYCDLLRQTIAELNGEILPPVGGAEMVVKADAYIPVEYIESEVGRIKYYKKIASVSSAADKSALLDELAATFGEPPFRVKNLIDIAYIKSMAAEVGATKVTIAQNNVEIVWQNGEFASSAAVKNSVLALGENIKQPVTDGSVLSFVPRVANVHATLNLLIDFFKHVKGDVL